MMGRWAQRFATAIERPSLAYAAALGAVLVAAAAREAVGVFMASPPNYMAFYPAVLFATLVAGARGGLIATGASALTVLLLWYDSPTIVPLVMFAATASATVFIGKAIRVAVRRGAAVEEQFRIFQEHALDAFVILEPLYEAGELADFRWTYANPAADRMAPVGLAGLNGRRVLEAFPDETGEDMFRRFSYALLTGGPDDIEVRRTIDGRERIMRSSAVTVTGGLAVTFRDITAERQSEAALRSGEARIRALVDSLPQLIWANQPDGACDYLSPQWLAFTGVAAERHYGFGWLDAIHPEDRDGAQQAWDQAVRGGLPFDTEYRLRRHDGVWRWFNARASAMRGEDGVVQRWFGAAGDITEIIEARSDLEARVAERTQALEKSLEERAQAEAALAQAQRMETVGRLTGGVAHDFNNLLTVVIGGLDMILKHTGDAIRVRRLAEAALSAGRRGERLTRQLLAFSRRQELKLEVADIAVLIDQAEPLIRRAVGEAVELSVKADLAAGASRLDPAQFEAALLNLVVNAADALPESGGRIVIASRPARVAEGQVRGAAAGDYVVVSVADNGGGMSPQTVTHAFEPFFTTKDVGKGTGLGLAQVYGFVTHVNGAVTIESAEGRGTTVSLYLPATQAPAAVQPPPLEQPGEEGEWARGARVLLVEDDAAVRAVTESLLTDFGCQVEGAPDGPTALRRIQSGERFDLLISDIVMPGGMSGVDLAKAAHDRDAALPIVLTTGYAGERLEDGPEGLAWPLLRKPFRAEQLGHAVREALGRNKMVA